MPKAPFVARRLLYPSTMRRFILVTLALTLFGGVASADRWRGSRDHGRDRRVVTVRDHRGDHGRYDRYPSRHVQPRRAIQRRPVYVSGNRYVFHGGYTRNYVRPVVHHRYYDYRVRPQILVENYESVPGYLWVAGNWQWNNYEWVWVAGHYEADPSYSAYEDDCD